MTPVTDLKDDLEGVINPLIGAHLLGSTGLIYFTDEVWGLVVPSRGSHVLKTI